MHRDFRDFLVVISFFLFTYKEGRQRQLPYYPIPMLPCQQLSHVSCYPQPLCQMKYLMYTMMQNFIQGTCKDEQACLYAHLQICFLAPCFRVDGHSCSQ